MHMLQRCPHRHITQTLGLCIATDSGGGQSLLVVERSPSTSSLQSMILYQMARPDVPVYTWKSALEWLVQVRLGMHRPHLRFTIAFAMPTSPGQVFAFKSVVPNIRGCCFDPLRHTFKCPADRVGTLPPARAAARQPARSCRIA